MKAVRNLGPHAVAVVAVLGSLLAAWAGTLPVGVRGSVYLASHGVLAATMLVAWHIPWAGGPSKIGRVWLLAGVLARLTLVPATSYTTHDVDRYLWDGRVLLEGLDPYRVTPADPEVAHLREQWPTPEEHAQYPTLYPPAALGLFASCAAAGPLLGPWLYRIASSLASLALLLLVSGWLRDTGRERHLPLVALHPLLILEAGVGAHVDIFAALGLVVGLRALSMQRPGLGGLAVGVGALFKPLPWLVLYPVFLASRPGNRIRFPAAALGLGLVVYGLCAAFGLRPVGSLPAFVAGWRFGSPLAAGVLALTDGMGGTPAGIALLALGGLGAAAIGVWTHRHRAMLPGALLMLALAAVLSPVVFPWYLLPLAALLPMLPSRFVLAWTLALPLTYEVIDRFDLTGAWEPAAWPLWGVAAGWGVGLWLDRRRAVESCGRSLPSS